MQELIRTIRIKLNYSQEQLAAALGVSPITISRWENGKAFPSALAQHQLFDICKNANDNLTDYLAEYIAERDRITNTGSSAQESAIDAVFSASGNTANMMKFVESTQAINLYHASRSGIVGKLTPSSRSKCDFGRGFYMGTDPLQPLTLICNESAPFFYSMILDTSNLNVLNVDVNLDWAMLIAYYRGYMDEFRESAIYDKFAHMADDCDVIVGYIADDRMYQVLTDFFEQRITDTALLGSLSALNLGKQYVAVSDKACAKITIVSERKLSALELMILREKSIIRRRDGLAIADKIVKEHRRDGRYFDEILRGETI